MKMKLIFATMALLTTGAIEHVPANLVISIDQTGANSPINEENGRVWNFGVTSKGADYFAANGLTFDSALFAAKDHKETTAPLVFTLYSGLGGNVKGNTALATFSMPSSAFNQQYASGAGSLFTFNPQLFTKGYYSVTLTSTADNDSTEDYFLKQGKLSLLNSNDTPLASDLWLQDLGTGNAGAVFRGTGTLDNSDSTLAPEPNALWVMAIVTGLSIGGSFLSRFQTKTAFAAVR